jgi:hypothetical protein
MRQVIIALDQLANAILAGHADETLSARAYRLSRTPVQRFPFLSTHRRTSGSNHLTAFPCGIIPVSRLE